MNFYYQQLVNLQLPVNDLFLFINIRSSLIFETPPRPCRMQKPTTSKTQQFSARIKNILAIFRQEDSGLLFSPASLQLDLKEKNYILNDDAGRGFLVFYFTSFLFLYFTRISIFVNIIITQISVREPES